MPIDTRASWLTGDLPYQLKMVCSGALETVQRLSIGKDWGETHVSDFFLALLC
jgi:hypothetical protein